MPHIPQRRPNPVLPMLLVILAILAAAGVASAVARRPSDSPKYEQTWWAFSAARTALSPDREAPVLKAVEGRLRHVHWLVQQGRTRLRWLLRQVSHQANWDAMAMCESSQRWHLNVGIFDGGLQFLPSTWDAYGGRQFARWAWQATRLEQIVIASRVLAVQGPSAWPSCYRSA